MKYAAIIVAAGSSSRMKGTDKIFSELAGKPVLQHCLEQFVNSKLFSEVIVVVNSARIEKVNGILDSLHYEGLKTVIGGNRRQDSVFQGLDAISICDYVAIHDGARPFVTQELLRSGIQCVRKTGAAIPVLPLQDTIKKIDTQYIVSETMNRNTLHRAQTPQFFQYDLIMEAHQSVDRDVTDDSTMVELMGKPVLAFQGDPNNVKITTQSDLSHLQHILMGKNI